MKKVHVNIGNIVSESMQSALLSLERQSVNTALASMGFNYEYGRWEIDHCNGRSSEMSRFVEKRAQEIIDAIGWTEDDVLNERDRKKLKRVITLEVKEKVKLYVNNMVDRAVQEYVARCIQEALAETDLEEKVKAFVKRHVIVEEGELVIPDPDEDDWGSEEGDDDDYEEEDPEDDYDPFELEDDVDLDI